MRARNLGGRMWTEWESEDGSQIPPVRMGFHHPLLMQSGNVFVSLGTTGFSVF